MMFPAGMAWAGPQDGQVAAGSATISHAGPRTDISQSSDRAVINWRDFSIGEGETVQFVQPSSRAVTLNRVTGAESSRLAGELLANGHVMLVNPNGIAFTSTAKIDVGSLTATTADIADADFMAGRYVFGDAPANSSILNAGRITVRDAGLAALVAPHVRNSGVIEAQLGTVELAAARGFTLDLYGDQLISFKLEDRVAETLKAADGRPLEALVSNDGTIEANGGRVYLTAHAAREVVNQSINTSGIIRAQSVAQDGGAIVLSGPGAVQVSGVLDASGLGAGSRGGNVRVLGDEVALAAGATVDVSGARAGGTALIGGDFQGKNPDVANARFTTIASEAAIRADGAEQGGRVIVWADDTTRYDGAISARGRGFVEVSGKGLLRFGGQVDTGGGTLLLDPTNITIQSGAGDQDSTFSGAQLATLLGSNDVTLAADNNITWNADAALDYNGIGSTGRTLTLQAGNTISFSGTISDGTAGGDLLNVVFNADRDASGAGAISIASGGSIFTSGGDLILRGGNAALSPLPAFTDSGYAAALVATSARNITIAASTTTLDAEGGNIVMRGAANSGVGVSITGTVRTSGSGTISIDGVGLASTGSNRRGVLTAGAIISTVNGAITLQGTGGGDGTENTGVRLNNTTVQATGSGNLTITGLGGTGSTYNDGVVADATILRVKDGDLTVTGTGRGTGTGSDGVELANGGVAEATGAGNVTLAGTSTASGASENRGVVLWLSSTTRSVTGSLTLQGSTNNPASGSAIELGSGGTSTIGGVSQTGSITLTADTMALTSGTVRGSGTLLLQPLTSTATIGLGNGATGTLNLTTAEIGLLQNGFSSITIGRSDSSGAIDVRTAAFLDPVTLRTPAASGSLTVNGTLSTGSGTSAGSITLQAGAGISLANGTVDTVEALTLTGGTYAASGTSTLKSNTLAFGNTNGIANTGTLTFNQTGNTTIANVISGTGDLVKAGTNTLTLAGSNTYSGVTVVNAGTLAITNPTGLGDTAGGTTVNLGATLDLQNVAVGAESVTLAGGGLHTSVGTSSLSGAVALPSSSTFSVWAGAELTVSGVISGSGGLTKNNSGTLVLSGTNTYTGLTTINIGGGTLVAASDSALGSTSGSLSLRAGGTLELRNVTIAEPIVANSGVVLVSTGASTLSGNVTGFQALPLNVLEGAQLTMTGVIVGPSSLVKNGGGTLTLTGNHTSNGASTINAGTVRVGDGGTTGTLTRGAVTVASGANLIFDRSDSVSLSTLANNAAGITGAGNITALIGGDFNVDRPIALSGPNSSILLEAGRNVPAGDVAGGDVTLTSNVSTSATGTITIFSGHATTGAYEAMISGATGATRYKTYGADASDTSGAVTGTRNYYYREQPGTLTVSGLTATKVYDGLIDATTALDGSSATFNGLIDGDSMTFGSLTLLDATFDSAHAGARSVSASFSGAAPTYTGGGAGWSVSGYAPSTMAGSGTGSITPKALTTSINAVGKTYDGTTSTTSTLGTLGGFIGNDSASGVSGLTLTFDNPNAGTRNVVATGSGTVAGFTGTASGNGSGVGVGNEVAGLASDYIVATPASASAVIGQAPLIVTANHDAKIVTQSDVSGYNGVSFDGFVNGEGVGNLSGSLSITRSNAGTEAAGTYNGVLLPTGYTSGNYAITYQAGDYRILPAQELLVKVQNVTNTYGSAVNYVVTSAQYLAGDGSTLHTLTQTARNGNTYTFSDGVGGSVTFTVTPSGAVISGAGQLAVGNYGLTGGNTAIHGSNFSGLHFVGNRAVTPAGLALSVGGVSKVYDGTTAMSGLTLTQIGALTGDLVWADGDGAFDSKNAGINVGYTLSNLALNGADAGNYYLTTGGSLSGTDGVITPRSITATGVVANDKTYDGTTAATLTLASAGLTNVVGGDFVSLDGSGYTASFADKNAGTGKAVALTGLGLAGADAGNYTLVQPTGLTANITPKAVSVTGVTANNKVYDGTTAATVGTGSASLSGIIAGDTVAIDGSNTTAAFADKNVGTGKLVMLTGLGLTGADAGNYTVTSSASATADITPRAISASGVVANHKVYDGTTAATLSFAGFDAGGVVAGDDVHLGDYLASFADKNVGTAKTVTVSGLGLAGADAGNYTFAAPTSFAADITPKALSLTGVVANDKVYDGTTSATLTITGPGLAGIVGADTVTLNSGSATAQFADKNAGANKAVLVAGLGLLGADAGNYTLGESGGLTASITPAALTVTANNQSRTYGDANPPLTVSYNGFVAGENAGNALDQLAVANTSAGSDSNVGSYAITASGAVAAHGNYTITYMDGALTVTPRAITLSADPSSKIFGAADPALSLSLIDGSLAVGDTLDSVTGLLTREAGEAAGLYDILLGQGSRAGNYAITFNADNDAFSITLPPRMGPAHAAGSVVADQRRNDWPDAFLVRDGTELVEPGLYEWRKGWRLLVAESFGRGDSAGQLADNVLRRIDRLVERSGFSSNNVQWREESL